MREADLQPVHTFFVGPRKTGTTLFYSVLKDCGMDLPADVKETYFFEDVQIGVRPPPYGQL